MTDQESPIELAAIDEPELIDELAAVADRQIDRVFIDRGRMKPVEMPNLVAIARAHFGDIWDDDPKSAIELTIRAAISGLEDAPLRDIHRMKKQEAAYRLFNLAEPRFDVVPLELEGISGQRYKVILADLYKRAGVAGLSVAGKRAPFTDLRKELAGKLLHPDFPNWPAPRPSVRGMLVRDELRNYYISRPDYEAAIRDRREAGITKIWLHGDAGTGKTRLAAGAHDDVPEAEVPVLRAIDESVLSRSVSAFLVDHGVSAEAINPINIWTLLLDVLNSSNHPTIVVFDDMFDGGVLDLLMRETKTTLILTSIETPPSTFQGSSLEVVDMSPDEAEGMIHSRLKDVSGEDLDALVSISGGRPLAIEHSCAFILETHMPVQEFCNAVLDRPASTLQVAGERFGRTLTAVYELTLERLASNPRTLWALDLLLFSQANGLSPTDLAEVWLVNAPFVGPTEYMKYPHKGLDFDEANGLLYGTLPGATMSYSRMVRFIDDASKVEMLGAIRQLERYGIIRARSDNNIGMHQLTRYLLRALRVESAPAIFTHLRREAVKLLDADNWNGGECLPSSLALWISRVQESIMVCWSPYEEIVRRFPLRRSQELPSSLSPC